MGLATAIRPIHDLVSHHARSLERPPPTPALGFALALALLAFLPAFADWARLAQGIGEGGLPDWWIVAGPAFWGAVMWFGLSEGRGAAKVGRP